MRQGLQDWIPMCGGDYEPGGAILPQSQISVTTVMYHHQTCWVRQLQQIHVNYTKCLLGLTEYQDQQWKGASLQFHDLRGRKLFTSNNPSSGGTNSCAIAIVKVESQSNYNSNLKTSLTIVFRRTDTTPRLLERWWCVKRQVVGSLEFEAAIKSYHYPCPDPLFIKQATNGRYRVGKEEAFELVQMRVYITYYTKCCFLYFSQWSQFRRTECARACGTHWAVTYRPEDW